MKRFTVIAVALIFASLCEAQTNVGYYRFPAIHDSIIVFTSEGDLWIVGTEGGTARRITSNQGVEAFATISQDGSTLAFSGEYEGQTELYTMPLTGGVPVRRTYDGTIRVVGWTPDGKILCATTRYSTLPEVQLLAFDPKTGSSVLMPLAQASDGSYDASGKMLFFTRFSTQGSHTKRYKGGTAQNIWKYAGGSAEAVPLTAGYTGTSRVPHWYDGRVYFVSDRDGTMNLWSMNPDGGDLQQLTFHKGWDVKSPSLDRGKIAYQLGADIYVYDIATKTDRLVPISLSSDFDQLREKLVKSPMEYLTTFNLSPNGDRVTITARGQIFVAPAEQGRFVRVTDDDRIRYRYATFMPDGKSLLALSDETGETEYVTLPANGVGEKKRLTDDGKVLRWDGVPSPDGKWIAYTDKNEEVWLFNIQEKKDLRIMKTDEGGPEGLAWSPDSKWLAYAKSAKNFFSEIDLYSVDKGTTTTVTSDRVDSFNPAWSPDGHWLYFLSDRVFQSVVPSPWGAHQPEPYFDKTRKGYALALTKDVRFPFLPNDEISAVSEGGKPGDKKDAKKDEKKEDEKVPEKKPVAVKIDLEGVANRLYEVPIPAGAYTSLFVNDKYLYMGERPSLYQGKLSLIAVEIKNKDVAAKTVLEDIRGYDHSADGKKIVVRKADDLYVIDASGSAPTDLSKTKVDLSNWLLTVNPRDEFRQMFVEAWRLERDYFYDPLLHGVDYKGLLQKHLAVLNRATDRDEVGDLISDLVGELSALHIFVYGGDVRRSDEKINLASLGTRLSRDDAAGGYRIDRIYEADPNFPDVISPLARPGLRIAEGDVIQLINGTPVLSVDSPDRLLENQAGQQVLLHIRKKAGEEQYDAIVKPISVSDDRNLRYGEWEETRREEVEKKGNGDIGYVHLRAMGGGNYAEWARNFYPVFDRKGLIIDVRNNQGGNIDSWILEKLMRKAWFYWQGRIGKPYWNMQYAFRGHMVVLCNEWTASDGEAFSEGFRRLGLGKVIGTRTWGGEIWLSSGNFLVDKGIATATESGVFGPEGQWLIEGHGVDPDTVVDNPPHATFGGEDAQLGAAIRYLQQQIKEHPVEPPKAPKYPDKSFKY